MYIGLLGALALDFGWFSLVLMFLIGFFAGSVQRSFEFRPSVANTLFNLYMLVLVSVFYFYFIIPVANGLPLLMAVIVSSLISKFKLRLK